MLSAPLVIRHAVDDLASFRIGPRHAALLGRRARPCRQAVAAEPGEIHQVDVLHIGSLAQVRHQTAKYGGFQFGGGFLVDRHGATLIMKPSTLTQNGPGHGFFQFDVQKSVSRAPVTIG